MTQKITLFAALCPLLFLLAANCGTPTTPPQKNSLILGVSIDPDNVNPLVAPYALSGYIIDLVNPGLARRKVTEAGLGSLRTPLR